MVKAHKKLVLVVNNKGGVGKSVVTRALADLYRSTSKTVHIFDADGGTGSLLLSYGERDDKGNLLPNQDAAKGVAYYDVRSDGSRNTLLDALGAGAPIVVHDMAGGSLGELKRIVDDGDGVDGLIDAIKGQGYEIVLLHVISNVAAATASVRDYMNAFGDNATHVAIINKTWGKDDADFPFWMGFNGANGVQKGGKARADLLANGGAEIHFPALQAGTFAKVDAENLPFTAALESADLSITEKAHLNKFLKASKEAFMEIKDKLGL